MSYDVSRITVGSIGMHPGLLLEFQSLFYIIHNRRCGHGHGVMDLDELGPRGGGGWKKKKVEFLSFSPGHRDLYDFLCEKLRVAPTPPQIMLPPLHLSHPSIKTTYRHIF